MPKEEGTLVVIKPDGVARNLIGKIISRYEIAGFRVSALKMMQATEAIVRAHYSEEENYLRTIGMKSEKSGAVVEDYVEFGRKVVNNMRGYMMSSSVVPIVLIGIDAVAKVREITGYTDPKKAERGTIRGDFGEDGIATAQKENRCLRNLVHASGTKEEARKEIAIWFNESEIHETQLSTLLKQK